MRYTPKIETTILIFCILITLALCSAIYFHGKTLNCESCVIQFRTEKRVLTASNEVINNASIMAKELYEGYLNGNCPVKFDKDWGFIYDNIK